MNIFRQIIYFQILMASVNYQQLTPDQAQKTYQDYIQTGKEQEALMLLFKYITSYQYRNRRVNFYQDQGDTSVASNISVLQKLMLSYINLRLDAGVNHPEEQNQLKEVFKSYRYMTQHQHTDAFLEVIQTYRDKVEEMFKLRTKGHTLEEYQKLPFVGQLNYEEPAEELLCLSFAPLQKSQKDQMKASLRLLWEAYRTIIENVKLNDRLEAIYFEIVEKLAKFCSDYKRKAEFQWFSDQINKYLTELNSRDVDPKKNPAHVDLSKSATNDKHVVLRFNLARIAIDLELWQDAYRLLESVLVLKNMRKGALRTSHLMTFFELLAKVFGKSNNYLYQAFAYYNHFLAFKKKPVASAEELRQKAEEMVSKVDQLILRVLVVPLYDQTTSESRHKEKMNNLFGAKVPDREELLKIVAEQNLRESASPIVRTVFDLLEQEQDLLSISALANEQFAKLKDTGKELGEFVPMLEENLIMKVLNSASNIFTTVKLSTLYQLLSNIKQERVQYNLLYANAHRNLDCRIDFVSGVITFRNRLIEPESQVLSNVFGQLQLMAVQVHAKQNIQFAAAARQSLEESGLQMISRQQTIKKLNKLSDPSQFDKLQKELRDKERKEFEAERKEEDRRKQLEQDRILEMLKKQEKEIATRRKLLNDIIKLKGKRFVTFEIAGEKKKIEKIKDAQLLDIDTNILSEIKKKFDEEAKKAADDKYVKTYKRIEYTERERRRVTVQHLAKTWECLADEQQIIEYQQEHSFNHQRNTKLKTELQVANQYKTTQFAQISQEREQTYELELKKWHSQLFELFADRVAQKADELLKLDNEEKVRKQQEENEAKAKRELEEELQKQHQQAYRKNRPEGQQTGGFLSEQYLDKPLTRNTGAVQEQPAAPTRTDNRTDKPKSQFTSTNPFSELKRNTEAKQDQPVQPPQPVATSRPAFSNTQATATANPIIKRSDAKTETKTEQAPPPAQTPQQSGFQKGTNLSRGQGPAATPTQPTQPTQPAQGTFARGTAVNTTQQQPQAPVQPAQPTSGFQRGTAVNAPAPQQQQQQQQSQQQQMQRNQKPAANLSRNK